MKTFLGVELGSTRIKAVGIDESFNTVCSGDYTWKSEFKNGIWTYSLDEAWKGLKSALSQIDNRKEISAMGISAMMHGYLAFDKDWNLLVPFRTWQNTITGEAAEKLTNLFNFNIPQRWSIAHLYQAVLNREPHIEKIAHITTLSGYVHYMLTGVNAIGVGEASGMFPIDSKTNNYDKGMLEKFQQLTNEQPWNIKDILPKVLVAGENAGALTESGAKLLDDLLPVGIPFAAPEGDAGTGMTATNSIAERTGNVSAGTSIFSMVVLEKPLSKVYTEIDMVTTPSGKPVAMVHCNNCTNDMNAWVNILKETAELFGCEVSTNELYTKLYNKSLEGELDCSGILTYNYMAGEGITHLDKGCPMVLRKAESNFSLANFLKSQLYATMSTLKIGMNILENEGVKVDMLNGHGGLFKTPIVAQKYMAAACNTPITCMETAGEGGPYGMALLAAYLFNNNISLEEFLQTNVFKNVSKKTLSPETKDVEGFKNYIKEYKKFLEVEQKAVELL